MFDRDPRHCPSADEVATMLGHLLPRGAAWAAVHRSGSVMARFFRAIADPLAAIETRLCDLWHEFFCHTAQETRDWWLIDHGLPSPCDPWPDPCVKRRTLAATRCEDWSAIAEIAGWALRCALADDCGAEAGVARADGVSAASSWSGPRLILTIDLSASPAWLAPTAAMPSADCYRADQAVGCGPDISTLQCLIEPLIPDHVGRDWRPING